MERLSTAERLKFIMETQNLKQIDILNLSIPFCTKYNVKMNKSDISQYVSGKVEPSQEKLVILGMALNVTESWLMGFDVPMERSSMASDSKSNIKYDNSDIRLQKIIDCYNGMTERGKDFLTDQAEICYKQFAQSTSKEGSA